MNKTPLVDKAEYYAKRNHDGQSRKFSDSPYFVHPRNTAKILDKLVDDPDVVASGYLHDIIENTDATVDSLASSFNDRIASIVKEITNEHDEVKEKEKKKHLKKKVQSISSDALLVKLADRYDNVNDLKTVPDSFSERYKQETREMLVEILKRDDLNNKHRKLITRIDACLY